MNSAKGMRTAEVVEERTSVLSKPSKEQLDDIVETSLDFCHLRSGHSITEVCGRLRAGDHWINSTFRYALTKEIRRLLAPSPGLRDIYLYGSVITDTARLSSDIDILVHVESDKQVFQEFLLWLDAELVTRFRLLTGTEEEFERILDFHVVNDNEVNHKQGYGSMINSAYPIMIRLR